MTTTRGGRTLVASLAVLAAVLVLAAGSFLASDDGRSTTLWKRARTVAAVRDAGVVYLPSHRVFLVDAPGEILALSAIGTQLEEPIAYCRTSGWFEDTAHGSKWDGLGYYMDGPAPRGMDRVRIRVREGMIEVMPSAESHGPPRGAGPGSTPDGPFCSGNGPGAVRQGFLVAE
jgi:hypothetical protein